ncbi:MAG: glycosyl transferase [Candidatus Parcubacteria bacterium]|nr:glycosyltransferase family 2 protein [Patescibacteria group bacterium]BCX16154.1 MAG: glycosyl transferase [Candidatus Parcubacteria bacterium]
MKKPYLSVIIPAYNEAKRLPLTLIDIDKHLATVNFDYEIIVVDNNSSDATLEIAQRFIPLIKNLKVIECKIQGKGAAVKKGILEAKGEIRLFTDADNSTSIDHFFKMEPYFKEGYEVVIGSRDVPGAQLDPPQPWYRNLLGDLGNIFIQLMVLKGIKDTQCGFKAFSEKAALSIFPLSEIKGWGFDVEILALARKMGYKIKEIPVHWVNSSFSHVKPSAYLNVLLEVVKIKIRLMRNKYGIENQSRKSA